MVWDVYALKTGGTGYALHSVTAETELELAEKIAGLRFKGTFNVYANANRCVMRAHVETAFVVERLA